MDRSSLRKHMRTLRQNADPALVARFGHTLLSSLQQTNAWRQARSIGLYLPFGGEASPLSVVDLARRSGREVLLPVVDHPQRGSMRFARWRPETEFAANRYGINEPIAGVAELVDPSALDLVLTPLVAYDGFGNRLGMGGGYYDRAFAGRSQQKPRLIGVAYGFQKVASLPVESWDVPLDAVITEHGLTVF